MLRPSHTQLQLLSSMERVAFHACNVVNQRPVLKRASHRFLTSFGAAWVHACTRSLLHVEGLDVLRSMQPDRGVMIAINHRSLFDMHMMTSVLLRNTGWVKRMYFPVRSTFFYDRLGGMVVNAVMSGLAMYPPIMRDPAKRDFNSYSVSLLTSLACQRGTVIGLHPEGRRNQNPNPYELLPAQPGTGQIVHAAKAIVVPAFVLGLCDNFLSQVRGNFDHSGDPITLVFGPPIDLDDLLSEPPRLRTYKRIADRVHEAIAAQGRREHSMRDRLGLPRLGRLPSTQQPARPSQSVTA